MGCRGGGTVLYERVMAYGADSRVDKDNIVLTGDRYGRGKRV